MSGSWAVLFKFVHRCWGGSRGSPDEGRQEGSTPVAALLFSFLLTFLLRNLTIGTLSVWSSGQHDMEDARLAQAPRLRYRFP